MRSDPFVAVALLTRRDFDVLGSGFRRAYPLENSTDFSKLLRRIDDVTAPGTVQHNALNEEQLSRFALRGG